MSLRTLCSPNEMSGEKAIQLYLLRAQCYTEKYCKNKKQTQEDLRQIFGYSCSTHYPQCVLDLYSENMLHAEEKQS